MVADRYRFEFNLRIRVERVCGERLDAFEEVQCNVEALGAARPALQCGSYRAAGQSRRQLLIRSN